MSKNIRPLAAYKKANPERYKIISSSIESTSKKGHENEFYWLHCYYNSGIEIFDGNLNRPPNPFFWKSVNEKNNKGTVTELGRLFLTGWYHNVEDFTKEVGMYVYRAYQRKHESGEAFNDLEFKDAVLHIRENIGYYYHNPNELKFYILETFFKEALKPLLPPIPEELSTYDKAIELIETIHKNRLKRDKNWYVKNFNGLESYIYYLMELLDCNEINYLSQSEYEAETAADNKAYFDNISELQKAYKTEIIQTVLNSGKNMLT